MNPCRICAGLAPGAGPSGMSTAPSSTPPALMLIPGLTWPDDGIPTQPESAMATLQSRPAHASLRGIRDLTVRSLIVGLLEGDGVVRRKFDRRGLDGHPALPGQGHPEAAPDPELRPHLEVAIVQHRVFQGDRQAEPRATDGSLARWIRAPEPIEDPLDLAGAHPDAIVAHRDRDRTLIAVDDDHDRAALAVLDGVAE